ncbi:transglutaminase-like domain-containing protein [Saccharopolyspora indica]|uniref:transglutaminase-like domain-containing protein n=1 Tax=Saccharopolyspora indica TaxID=1229659 RepID=UPI0022EA7E68|nr:transglutaminase-like domain-containing protein [Saccharopolyspora indica]MDA3647186.1 transglutaminase-like domain-containing protein [Saccharopolyspora indica]
MSSVFVVLAAAVAGLMFAPVFGVSVLVFSVGVLTAVLVAVAALASRRAGLTTWLPLLLAGVGLLVVVESMLWSTTVAGLPTVETLRALAFGVTDSWQLALQSTWPARPDAQLSLFVPLLVVAASALGTALLEWFRSPIAALLPSLAVVVLAQLYSAASGWAAVFAALAYAAAAGALLVAVRGETVRDDQDANRLAATLLPSAGSAAVALVCAVVAGALVPSPAPRYALKDDWSAPVSDVRVTSPLDELVHRMTHPDDVVFRVRGADAGRWPVVVLTEFDGTNWSPGGRYRRLGTELRPSPAVTVPTSPRSADVEPVRINGPWLPSQTWPAGVRGADPLVEEDQGTLLATGPAPASAYTLTWWEPEISADALRGAELDPDAPGGLAGVGTVPEGVSGLAERAVQGLRPTFDAALQLERHFRQEYRLAAGENLPTGHSWPQLTRFLLQTKRGTSEQFAAAYVALARIRGIPARLVVGYADPAASTADGSRVVRNGDAVAWPEVAVEGVGWVPLDPTGTATASGSRTRGGVGSATERARDGLPASQDLRDPPVPAGERDDGSGADGAGFRLWSLGVPVGLILLLPGGVPVATAIRARRRRRRSGAGAVIGAWEEVRDRLRAHGVAVSAGMTVRDLAAAAGRITDQTTVDGIHRLGGTVDLVLWSGAAGDPGSGDAAWAAVRNVRAGLARRGFRARLRAALDPRTLRPPR